MTSSLLRNALVLNLPHSHLLRVYAKEIHDIIIIYFFDEKFNLILWFAMAILHRSIMLIYTLLKFSDTVI